MFKLELFGNLLLVGEAREIAFKPDARDGVRGVLVSDLDRSRLVGVFGFKLLAMEVIVGEVVATFQRRTRANRIPVP